MQHQHQMESEVLSWLIPLLIIAFLYALYLAGIFMMRQLDRRWSKWRTFSFTGGILLLAVALSPGMMQLSHQDFRGHMGQHLLIGMLAPLGLVLGAPLTLALTTLPRRAARVISKVLKSAFFHFISHPVSAFILNIGGMFALYLSPLYKATFIYPSLHYLIHLHFLMAGYLFTWSIAGPDPAPRRPKFRIRLIVLFLSMAAHAYLSKFMYAYLYPLWTPHSDDQIRSGAKLMYYGGDLAELLLAIALLAFWYKTPQTSRLKKGFSLAW